MEALPRKWMTAAALLLGSGAIVFAALPAPVLDRSASDELQRPLSLSAETQQQRSSKRPEPPALLDFAALPAGASIREVDRLGAPATSIAPSNRFDLPQVATLVAEAVDLQGQPISGARLVYTPRGQSSSTAKQAIMSDLGSCETEELAPGRYRVHAVAEGFLASQSVEVEIPRALGESVRLILHRID